jgi:nucleotide-binding universal stress UspA family protein
MTSNRETVVVGVDGSESSLLALQWAAREATLHGWSVTALLAWDLLDQHHIEPSAKFDPEYR